MDWYLYKTWIQKLPTFPLHRPDLSQCAFGYCSCKQDTKEQYWGHQLCQMKTDILVQPSEMTRQVKVDHLQSWSWIIQSDQTEMVRSICCANRNFQNFGLNGKCPFCKIRNVCKPYQTRSWKWFGIKYEGLKGHSWMQRSKNGIHITVAILGRVTLHMIYWTPLLIKSAFVWKVILGVRDLTKYSVRFGRTQNFLMGYRIWLLLGKWDLPKSWQVLGKKMIFWDRDLFI